MFLTSYFHLFASLGGKIHPNNVKLNGRANVLSQLRPERKANVESRAVRRSNNQISNICVNIRAPIKVLREREGEGEDPAEVWLGQSWLTRSILKPSPRFSVPALAVIHIDNDAASVCVSLKLNECASCCGNLS